MSEAIQIRDVEDDVSAALVVRAAEAGMSVPELLRREASRLAAGPTVAERLDRTRRRPADITSDEVAAVLDVEVLGVIRRFVAFAEALDATLLTLDQRLTRATGPRCRFVTPTG